MVEREVEPDAERRSLITDAVKAILPDIMRRALHVGVYDARDIDTVLARDEANIILHTILAEAAKGTSTVGARPTIEQMAWMATGVHAFLETEERLQTNVTG